MNLISMAKPAITIAPATHSASTVTGTAVDIAGYKDVMVQVLSGTNASGATADVHIEESADGSTNWADITSAAFTQITTSNDGAMYCASIRMTPTRKRYLRAVAVVATDTCGLAVALLLGSAKNEPVNTGTFSV